jgi:protein-disulfide isomerase
MNANDVPRIAAPVLLAAAILLSAPREPSPQPIELSAGEAPTPSATEIQRALGDALAPDAPGYDRGATRAPVTVLEFADFGCPYCGRFAVETYPALAKEYVTPGAVRWRAVPFVLGMFPHGAEAARAAVCAGEQGRETFGRMHDRLFTNADEWKSASDAAGVFASYAHATGLDEGRFAACYASARTDARVRAANDLADRLGVRATPTFFINGYRIEGALPVEQFRTVLSDARRGPDGH